MLCMNRILTKLIFLSCFLTKFWAGIIPLPTEINIKFGVGYNSNFLRFSESEMENAGLDPTILGDSPTFDTAIWKTSINTVWKIAMIKNHPTKIQLNFSKSDFQQSPEKKYNSYKFQIAQKIDSYRWIKIGYQYIPQNYLRMYSDKDQIGEPIEQSDFSFEKFLISYSHPLIFNSWGRIQYYHSNRYFNPEFTEFDMETDKIELKIHNNYFNNFSISNWVSGTVSENISFQPGMISTDIDRSYLEYQIGNGIGFNTNFPFVDKLQTTFIWSIRKYSAEDLTDHLHESRTHNQLSISQKAVSQISPVLVVSAYYRYIARSTDSNFEWVDNLKSYTQHEFGLQISINLTDNFYELIY